MQPNQYSDFEIIDKISGGEIKLYEVLIRRYNGLLYKIARSYGYQHDDAQDLMQEVYISAFYNLSKFEKRASFKTWITRIMVNECFQKKQKLSFKKEIKVPMKESENTNPMFHQAHNSEKMLVNKELGHVLENALHKIPEEYRIVFTLRELNGLSTAETMEALNLSESNVKVRLNRVKKMLRAEIEKMYSPTDIFEFNLIYCDRMVDRVMTEIEKRNNLIPANEKL